MSFSRTRRATNPDSGPSRTSATSHLPAVGPDNDPHQDGVLCFSSRPNLQAASFVVGWTKDTGAVSRLVADHLIRAANGIVFCQIDPATFYSVGGVTVTDDVAQLPGGKFFYSQQHHLVVLQADEPQSNRHGFFSTVLNLAQREGNAKALYTANGIAAMAPHTAIRRGFAVFNDPVMRRQQRQVVPSDMSWQGPPLSLIHI